MKKIMLSMAALGMVFAACNKSGDNTNDDVKKLPSKETTVDVYTSSNGTDTSTYMTSYEYDNQNRLTKIYWDGEMDYAEIQYNTNNTPAKYITYYNGYTSERTFEYVGDTVLYQRNDGSRISTDTLILSNGQLVKWCFYGIDAGSNVYTYANGNVINLTSGSWSIEMSYSDVKSIFRYANMPDWFLVWFFDCTYSKEGYMLSKWTESGGYDDITYTTNSDGYAATRVCTSTYTSTNSMLKKRQNPSQKGESYSGGIETTTYEYVDVK